MARIPYGVWRWARWKGVEEYGMSSRGCRCTFDCPSRRAGVMARPAPSVAEIAEL